MHQHEDDEYDADDNEYDGDDYDDDDDDDYFYSIEDPLRGSTAGPPFLILDVAEFHFGRCSESSKLHGKTFENQCLEASECP